MCTIGRPVLYRPEYSRPALDCCESGATNEKLTKFFKVAPVTIGIRSASIPEFVEAIPAGRADAVDSFFQRVMEYRYAAERIMLCHSRRRKRRQNGHTPNDVRTFGNSLLTQSRRESGALVRAGAASSACSGRRGHRHGDALGAAEARTVRNNWAGTACRSTGQTSKSASESGAPVRIRARRESGALIRAGAASSACSGTRGHRPGDAVGTAEARWQALAAGLPAERSNACSESSAAVGVRARRESGALIRAGAAGCACSGRRRHRHGDAVGAAEGRTVRNIGQALPAGPPARRRRPAAKAAQLSEFVRGVNRAHLSERALPAAPAAEGVAIIRAMRSAPPKLAWYEIIGRHWLQACPRRHRKPVARAARLSEFVRGVNRAHLFERSLPAAPAAEGAAIVLAMRSAPPKLARYEIIGQALPAGLPARHRNPVAKLAELSRIHPAERRESGAHIRAGAAGSACNGRRDLSDETVRPAGGHPEGQTAGCPPARERTRAHVSGGATIVGSGTGRRRARPALTLRTPIPRLRGLCLPGPFWSELSARSADRGRENPPVCARRSGRVLFAPFLPSCP